MKTVFLLLGIIVLLPNMCSAQMHTISGYIKSSVGSNSIENVNVFESVSGIGTISNSKGYFKLILNDGEKNIDFSVNGFKTISKKLDLSSDTTITVQLDPTYSSKRQNLETAQLAIKPSKKIFGRWLNKEEK